MRKPFLEMPFAAFVSDIRNAQQILWRFAKLFALPDMPEYQFYQ